MTEQTIYATILAPLITGAIGFLVVWYGRRFDARGQAEAALMGIGPVIIQEQNKRIDELSRANDDLWRREHQCQRDLSELRSRMERVERRLDNDG